MRPELHVSARAQEIGARVEQFVRTKIIPFERDPRRDHHDCPTGELVDEMRDLAREAGVMTPHILSDESHLNQVDTAYVLIRSGLSPLGPIALNVGAPDEGNMYLLGKVASQSQKERFLEPMIRGEMTSAFLMTEPADEGGAGSDPSMMKTTCRKDGQDWIIDGRKCFATGATMAGLAIIMARAEGPDSGEGACMFLADLPHDDVVIEHVPNTIDSSMPGGHPTIELRSLRVPSDRLLGEPGEGFAYAQVRLAPARLSHCMRWLGACIRAQEIALDYACRREAFGKLLIDHEGVGFKLAENSIELRQAEQMVYWCASELDAGGSGVQESSMTKVAVSEALMRVADNCVQVMGGTGVSNQTVVEQIFREIRAFRIYDGPTEVHKWSLAKRLKRNTIGKGAGQ